MQAQPFVFMPSNSVSISNNNFSLDKENVACLLEVDLTHFKNNIEYSNGKINETSINAWIFSLLRSSIIDLLEFSDLHFKLKFPEYSIGFDNVLSMSVSNDGEADIQNLSKQIYSAKGLLRQTDLRHRGIMKKKDQNQNMLIPMPDRHLYMFKYLKFIYNSVRSYRKTSFTWLRKYILTKGEKLQINPLIDISISRKVNKRFIYAGNVVDREVYPVTVVMNKRVLWGISAKQFRKMLLQHMEHKIRFFPVAV